MFSTKSDRLVAATEFPQHLVNGLDLRLGVRVARVHDVQQQPGLPGLFQRRLERGDQMVRQVADEADRVAEQDAAPLLDVPLAGARVERREELVLDVDAGPGQGVHERALAGVGVADQRDGMFLAAAGHLALLARLHLVQAVLEVADAQLDEPAVLFELRFAGAARADAGGGAAQVGPHLAQARQGVLELGQFHLEAGLGGAGAGGEDVEDQLAAVEDLDLGRFFQVADLRRRQVVVEEDDVGVGGRGLLLEFLDLALADVAGGVDLHAPLAEAADDEGAGGGRPGRAALRAGRRRARALRQFHADEEGAFEMDGQFIAGGVEGHVGVGSSL